MKFFKIIFFISLLIIASTIIINFPTQDNLKKYDENSSAYVGAKKIQELGFFGEGVKIGIIDTGINYNHPDLFGYGENGKVVGGYNFVNEKEPPLDNNGHGTEVAGVIAADGISKGIAPKAKLYAYKVSEDGESVSADLIVNAIHRAIEDKVDIINISLGVNKTNSKINDAVDEAIRNGIIVVGAAGNDGPTRSTIGSPGNDHMMITTGATYNNLTSSLVSTLEVNNFQYQVVPMLGDSILKIPITAEIVFGKYGRQQDLDGEYSGKIILEERGSDDDEKVYFSTKEKNAADAGAIGLVVYNNEPGLFLGELVHEFVDGGYHPRIPVVSISREEGLKIKETLENKTTATLHVFSNPDYVVHFSSRGPVSPFFIKPNLVAPGAFINSTTIDGKYNFTSGTSFAAPHVSGAAALLLNKYPKLNNQEVKSLILTTTDVASDAYGKEFPLEAAGAGRLNVTRAAEANLIMTPSQIIVFLSANNPTQEKELEINPIIGNIGEIEVKFNTPNFVKADYNQDGEKLDIKFTLLENKIGDYDGRIFIKNNSVIFNIPIEFHVTEGTIFVSEKNGLLNFEIASPKDWSFAKVTITNSENHDSFTTSFTRNTDKTFPVYHNGEYWIEAKIKNENNTYDAYSVVTIGNISEKTFIPNILNLPVKQIVILFILVLTISIIGIIFSKKPKVVDPQF